jgi:hypothetical protein
VLRRDDPFAQVVVPDHPELDRLHTMVRVSNLDASLDFYRRARAFLVIPLFFICVPQTGLSDHV